MIEITVISIYDHWEIRRSNEKERLDKKEFDT